MLGQLLLSLVVRIYVRNPILHDTFMTFAFGVVAAAVEVASGERQALKKTAASNRPCVL